MTTLVLTDPTNGTVADANTIASNNTATKAVVNGNIDNANVAAAAAIAATKLAAGGSGQVLGMLAGIPTWLGGFAKINDSTLGSPAATIDFASIPTTYAHLLVSFYAQDSSAPAAFNMKINNDAAANYYDQMLTVSASTSVAGLGANASIGRIGRAPQAANLFCGGIAFIPYYTQATNKKTFFSIGTSWDTAGSTGGFLECHSGLWNSTAAINQLTFSVAANLNTGTRVTLYGLGV